MVLFWLRNVSISFQGVPVLEDVNAFVSQGARVGIIGPNGCGKSTLLKMITGSIKPGQGAIDWAKTPKVGYMPPQEDSWAFYDGTPLDLIGPEHSGMLGRFGLARRLCDQPVSALSGGERGRLLLAVALSRNPDLLVIDEPTNHMDINGIEALETLIKGFAGTVIIASHDRYFLDSVCTEIWRIENHQVKTYKGNYSAYMEARRAEEANLAREYSKWQDAVGRLGAEVRSRQQWYEKAHRDAGKNDYLRRRSKKHASQFKAKRRRLDKLMEHKPEKPRAVKPVTITFQEGSYRTKTILRADNLSFSYEAGTPPIISHAGFSVSPGEKIAIVGPNGCGKTTMIRLFARDLHPEQGSLWVNPNIQVGYLAQMLDHLDLSRSAADNVSIQTGRTVQEAKHLLGYLGISKHTQVRPLEDLSTGQRTKVALACLTFAPFDLLLLDEPTNHLDVTAREAAEEALAAFPGAVIVATHDRFLIDKVCTSIWYLEKGRLHVYQGSYSGFRNWIETRKQGSTQDKGDSGGAQPDPALPEDRKAMELALKTRLAYIASQLAVVDDELEKLQLESEYEETLAQLKHLDGGA